MLAVGQIVALEHNALVHALVFAVGRNATLGDLVDKDFDLALIRRPGAGDHHAGAGKIEGVFGAVVADLVHILLPVTQGAALVGHFAITG